MARKTTPRRRGSQNRKLSRQQEAAKRRKLAEQKAMDQQARDESIAAFHEKAQTGNSKATTGSKQAKKSNILKISMWAALVLLFAVPTVLLSTGIIGDWMRTKNALQLNTAAGGSAITVLSLQPYAVPLNQKTSLQFNSYLELTKAEAANTVCHYMPRYKAAILGVLNIHFSKGDPSSVDRNAVVSDMQHELKKSVALKEIRNVHVQASTIDVDNKKQAISNKFPSANMIACQ